MNSVQNDCETELQHAKERILATEADLRTVIEMNADGILIVNSDEIIRFANPAAASLFNSTPSNLLGKPFGFPLVENDLAEIDIVPSGQRDGPKIAEMRAVKIEWEGSAAYLVSIRDMTAKKRAEEALRAREEQIHQAQRLETIGRLAAEIAHEINDVLMGISGCARVAIQSLDETALAHVFVRKIQRATEQGIELLEQLLTHARSRPFDPRPIDLNGVVGSMTPLIRHILGPSIELVANLDPELWRVTADTGQFEQILTHLVMNARDAMQRGGKITITTKNAEAGDAKETHALSEEDHVILSVTDTGGGMDETTMARAFEPLFSTKPSGRGTGLGLSTVRAIVEESGGCVYIKSVREQGTTVTICLPGRAAWAHESPAQRQLDPESGADTVLLVDDEELIRLSLRYELTTNGYRTLDAANGAAALDICTRYPWPIHVLVADLRMPEMNGRELARRATEIRPGLKVIFMTGYTSSPLTKETLTSVGHTILEKPFPPDVLVKRVREVLTIQG